MEPEPSTNTGMPVDAAGEPPMICPTLPTYMGMVLGGGAPQPRAQNGKDREVLNEAAMHDPNVTLDELKRYIKGRKRLDVEQAVAMVLSVLAEEQAASLVPHAADLLTDSCMWREDKDYMVPGNPIQAARAAYQRRIAKLLAKSYQAQEPLPTAARQLAQLLIRVRRHRPGLDNSQRLQLPAMLLDALPELSADERAHWSQDTWQGAGHSNTAQAGSADAGSLAAVEQLDTIMVSKKNFKRIAQLLYRITGDQSAAAVLNREVAALSDRLEYGRLPVVLASQDVPAVAFSFLALQRHLQLKVVSDLAWTRFLAKGEGRLLQQNAPHVLTSLELELARMALAQPHPDYAALTAVVTPPGCGEHVSGSVERLHEDLTEVCKLMQRYVVVHAEGNLERLGPRNRDRGPVDQYNLLCDLVYGIRARCRALGAPEPDIGPCHKFLARDIMAWNQSWADDAFAPGKVPGWMGWLQRAGDLTIAMPAVPAEGAVNQPAAEEPAQV